jgi:WD40 repeat protein
LLLPRRRFAMPGLPGLLHVRGWSHAFVAPVAAAATMTALVAGIVVIRSGAPGSHGTVNPAVALRALPRYEVALTYAGQVRPWLWRTDAVVASTATGRRIATIRPPAPYNSFVAVTGSADGRHYVLAAQRLSSNFRAPQSPTQFYELRIQRHKANLTTLPTPILRALTLGDIALSPDGSRLAVTGTGPFPGYSPDAGVRIYDLATGKLEHAWGVVPPPPPGKCCVFSPTTAAPSWTANSQHLALDVSLAHCQDCVMLLDTTATGTSVQAVGRVILRTHNRHYPVAWTNTLVTPDGSHVLRSALVGRASVPFVFRYSARSARLSLRLRGSPHVAWKVVWSSPSGRSFVVVNSPQRGFPGAVIAWASAAIYQAGHLAPLPLPARTVTVAW